jgi:hypothetical protein
MYELIFGGADPLLYLNLLVGDRRFYCRLWVYKKRLFGGDKLSSGGDSGFWFGFDSGFLIAWFTGLKLRP